MIRCLSCGAETSNGLALCALCRGKLELDLQFLPVYFRNLARWRPGRAGSRPVPGSRVLYDGETRGLGTGDRISDHLDETQNALSTWAEALVDDRPYLARLLDRLASARRNGSIDEQRSVAWLCTGFNRYLTSLATLDWCGEFAHEMGRYESTLRALTETAMPGWYAGACRHCQASTHVIPGFTWVTCGGCGAVTYARDHLDVIIAEAAGWVARPMRLAEAVVALVDTEVSVPRLHKRISKCGERGRISTVRKSDDWGDPIGPKRHWFGEVLDVLFAEGATRLEVTHNQSARISA